MKKLNHLLTRRRLLSGSAAALLGMSLPFQSFAQTRAKLVVIGGGFGGAIAARRLKALLPNSDVTLIEPNETYTACPFSNLVIDGSRNLALQEFRYDKLASTGVTVAPDRAVRVDTVKQSVHLHNGSSIPYDRLVLSPGIDIRWGALEGYDESAQEFMPHAWKAGVQTTLLRQQLMAMEDGGLVVISSPPAPYRCPPGPYERASLIANYLKTHKPKSKLLVLDSKDNFSKKALFLEAWDTLYPDNLEWRGASEDGRVSRVDSKLLQLETDFETIQADVVNIVPPQKAGSISDFAGVSDETGWCPVDATRFESLLQPKVHVIGDASIAAPMPKSAFSANLQGKICAMQIARLMSDLEPLPTTLVNNCYSFISPDQAVSVTGVYTNAKGRFRNVPDAGGTSPLGYLKDIRVREAGEAIDWFRSITSESFG